MRPRAWAGLLATLLLLTAGAVLLPQLPAAGATATYPPVQGNISGPAYVALQSSSTYYINGSGGPAEGTPGVVLGNISWAVRVTGPNLTGVSVSPNASNTSLGPGQPGHTKLKVGNITETLTLAVEITSTQGTLKASTNLTYTVHVVVPYVVRATLVAGPQKVGPFVIAITLDGRWVANVTVPAISANKTYNLTYSYASAGLSAGNHTFTISLASEHGLVTFSGGALQYSETFYVAGPSPDYFLWGIVGVVVFFGVLFIFAARVAARRRPPSRK